VFQVFSRFCGVILSGKRRKERAPIGMVNETANAGIPYAIFTASVYFNILVAIREKV
jgi:hypothetical protein